MSRPNILFIMCDDHAANAISAYGSGLNQTPHIDRLADEGMRLDRCYVTNSICTPSRAAILTGTHNHVNLVTTLDTHLDNRLPNVAKHLRSSGYQTGMFGKWHLGEGRTHEPTGFDAWSVLPGQGDYFDPEMIGPDGPAIEPGYATDIITDKCLEFLDNRDTDRPFFLMCHHKAPHRPFVPHPRYDDLYTEDLHVPETFDDDYANRAAAAAAAKMRVREDMTYEDLGLVMPIDDNVGRMLDYLDAHGLTEDTIVIYTSDQGFFLGEHGWFDKRFMYEESLQMPFLVRHPASISAGTVSKDIATNVDFAPTFLDYAGAPVPSYMQGVSLRPLMEGKTDDAWQDVAYHRYWMNMDDIHNAYAHYGIRSDRYKLIYWYNEGLGQLGANDGDAPPEWELFDCDEDPNELVNLAGDPGHHGVFADMLSKLDAKMEEIGDEGRHDTDAVRANLTGAV